jgi:hypothetical protein
VAREGEETLGSYAKRVCAFFVKTTKGRIWLGAILAYSVVGPVIVRILLPDGTEPSFWVDFFQQLFRGGPGVIIGIALVIFLVNPLVDRWRVRRATKDDGVAG